MVKSAWFWTAVIAAGLTVVGIIGRVAHPDGAIRAARDYMHLKSMSDSVRIVAREARTLHSTGPVTVDQRARAYSERKANQRRDDLNEVREFHAFVNGLLISDELKSRLLSDCRAQTSLSPMCFSSGASRLSGELSAIAARRAPYNYALYAGIAAWLATALLFGIFINKRRVEKRIRAASRGT